MTQQKKKEIEAVFFLIENAMCLGSVNKTVRDTLELYMYLKYLQICIVYIDRHG